jgi:membrane-bound metal-dependent hydrolase YbcI (DUF457 family)
MNTQTHMLMGAALFGRPMPRLAWAAVAGGIAPDVPMYLIVAGLRMVGYPMREIFERLYWENWWQIANAIGHSFVLWGGLVAVSLALLPRPWSDRFAAQSSSASGRHDPAPPAGRLTRSAPLLFAVSASALLHSAIDFLVHRDDAHMQFWPLTEWRFRSPLSYWDPAHGGTWFGLFEAALGILLIVVLFRRYRSRRLRALLALALVLYAAVPAYFIFGMAHH